MRRVVSALNSCVRSARTTQTELHACTCVGVSTTRCATTQAQEADSVGAFSLWSLGMYPLPLTLIPGVLFLLSVVGADRASSGVRGDGLVSRFYKTVSVIRSPTDAGWHVTLDGRTLRTPAKAQLLLPTHALALAVAAEWEWQDAKNIRPFTMPLMVRKLSERTFDGAATVRIPDACMPFCSHQGLCSTAVDRIPLTRGPTITQLLKFFETDSLCVRSDNPRLAAQQATAWEPLLDWVHTELGARPAVSDSIFGALDMQCGTHAIYAIDDSHIFPSPSPGPQQPQAVVEALTQVLVRADDWQLAGITAASAAARSLIAALALARGRIRPAEAPILLRVEENFQTEEWGVVEGGHDIDAADLAARCAAPAVFLGLLRDT